jgi:putative transcriptional regulator
MQNVKLQLEKVLKDRNKTMYALAKETGTTYATIHKLAKDDVKYVQLEILEKICINLNCTPNDILPIRP